MNAGMSAVSVEKTPAVSPNFTHQALTAFTYARTQRGTFSRVKETEAQAGEVMELEKWPASEPNTDAAPGAEEETGFGQSMYTVACGPLPITLLLELLTPSLHPLCIWRTSQ